MPKAALLKRLDEFHAELNSVRDLDAESIEALQRLAGDIRNLIEGPPVEPSQGEALGASLREQIEQLESEYPLATRLLSQMTDVLGLLGI
jgi:hypothetical protein